MSETEIMTNGQKFRTTEERAEAFREFCRNEVYNVCNHSECKLFAPGKDGKLHCYGAWLALKVEEKLEPCFYCGGKMVLAGGLLRCDSPCCGYRLILKHDPNETITAHNYVAHVVRAAKEGEVK